MDGACGQLALKNIAAASANNCSGGNVGNKCLTTADIEDIGLDSHSRARPAAPPVPAPAHVVEPAAGAVQGDGGGWQETAAWVGLASAGALALLMVWRRAR